jgi:hypothetical protein
MASFKFDTKGMADPLIRARQGLAGTFQNLGRGFGRRREAKDARLHDTTLQAADIASREGIAERALAETQRANKAKEDIDRLQALVRQSESEEERIRLQALLEMKREELDLLIDQSGAAAVGDADLANMARTTFNRVAYMMGGTPDPENPGRFTVAWPTGEVEYAEFRKNFMQEAQNDLEMLMAGLPEDVRRQQLETQLGRVRTMLGERDTPGPDAPRTGLSQVSDTLLEYGKKLGEGLEEVLLHPLRVLSGKGGGGDNPPPNIEEVPVEYPGEAGDPSFASDYTPPVVAVLEARETRTEEELAADRDWAQERRIYEDTLKLADITLSREDEAKLFGVTNKQTGMGQMGIQPKADLDRWEQIVSELLQKYLLPASQLLAQ